MRLTVYPFIILSMLLTACQDVSEDQSYLLRMRTDTEINFTNQLIYTDSINPYTYRNFYNGSGVAIGDLDNDGLDDLFFTGNQVDNQLYQNRGNFQFKDVTEGSGTASTDSWCTGASMVDINADGLLDIYVCKAGPPSDENRRNQLFINQGDFRFVDQAADYGLDILGLSIHAVFFDFDRDGDLDVYLLNNSLKSVGAYDLVRDQRDIASEDGNQFLVNEDGRFVNKTRELGIYSSSIGFGLGIAASDFNQDGYLDLYVGNDFFEKDYYYLNQAGKGFKEVGEDYFASFPLGSMGVDAADYDNDQQPDIFVAEMLPKTLARKKTKAVYDSWEKYSSAAKNGYYHQYPRNMLFQNQQEHGFTELARMNDMAATDWSWAPLFMDIDMDGYKDLFVSNGIGRDLLDRDYLNYMSDQGKLQELLSDKDKALAGLIDLMPAERVQNAIFKNQGDGSFADESITWTDMPASFSNASAYGDLDNDGDLDLVISNVDDPAFILENTTTDRSWIGFRLSSAGENDYAIGAQITAYHSDGAVMQEQMPYRGFQSSVSPQLSLALGDVSALDSVLIRWPNGEQERLENLALNEYHSIQQGVGLAQYQPQMSHHHHLKVALIDSLDFDRSRTLPSDFNRDPLIPYMYALPEPVVATVQDKAAVTSMVIGGTKGIQSTITEIGKRNSRMLIDDKKMAYAYVSDIEVVDVDLDGDQDIYLAHGSRMFTPYSSELHDQLLLNDGAGSFTLQENALPFSKPVITSSVSSGDMDGDGYPDLAVTELMADNTYGRPGSLYLFLNDRQGGYTAVAQEELQDLGMITCSAMADLDGDGRSEIMVAGEWMGIRAFSLAPSGIIDVTQKYHLGETRGLWQTMFMTDIDQDGDLDMIAGNMGQNSYFTTDHALLVQDLDANGKVEQLLLQRIDGEYYPVQDFEELFMRVPIIKKKFDRYSDYAAASLADLVKIDTADIQSLDLLQSTLFLNDQGRFVRKTLPREAQHSSVHAIAVHDVDADGVSDILLGGNHYRFKPQYARSDASTGLLILGSAAAPDYGYGPVHQLGITGEINSITPIADDEYVIGLRNQKLHQYQIKLNRQ